MAYERAIDTGGVPNPDWLESYMAAAQGATPLARGAFIRDGVCYQAYSAEPDAAALAAVDAACAAAGAPPAPVSSASATVLPSPGLTLNLGSADARWDNVFCSAVNTLSDRNCKADIEDLPAGLGLPLVSALRPVAYRMAAGRRTHVGLLAQDVAAALRGLSEDPAAWGLWCRDAVPAGSTPAQTGLTPEAHAAGECQSLRYEQLVPCLIAAVQTLTERLADATERLDALEPQVRWACEGLEAVQKVLRERPAM